MHAFISYVGNKVEYRPIPGTSHLTDSGMLYYILLPKKVGNEKGREETVKKVNGSSSLYCSSFLSHYLGKSSSKFETVEG